MTTGQRVRDIGEFALIAALQNALPEEARASEAVTVGIGDDCALWTPVAGEPVAVTTDMLVQDVHFRLDWTDWPSLGYKTLAVNLSDLASMGATPVLATVSLGLRGDEAVADLEAMYRALGELGARTGCVIAGGDIVRSPRAITLSVSALGACRHGPPLRRDGARPGDVVAVSGTLGASATGLRLLAQPVATAATASLLIEAHLRPEPRLALGELLAAKGATAAMDLSDGLFGDLPKLLTASGVRGQVDLRRIPVAAAVRALCPDDWLALATRGGEDYELLFTLPPELVDDVTADARAIGATITPIGVALPAGDAPGAIAVIDLDGAERTLAPGAFDHFASE